MYIIFNLIISNFSAINEQKYMKSLFFNQKINLLMNNFYFSVVYLKNTNKKLEEYFTLINCLNGPYERINYVFI
ncbi:hypothetical protein UREOM_4290 [Ureaplasma sp. OM1]|uniref:Uncharacterized protein n=1 Tax=Ureaplasma ceti TaxID=3119530 RepID=A0ABP9UC04_9BACT